MKKQLLIVMAATALHTASTGTTPPTQSCEFDRYTTGALLYGLPYIILEATPAITDPKMSLKQRAFRTSVLLGYSCVIASQAYNFGTQCLSDQ